MEKVSDLLKTESFRQNQLYHLLISKFKEGTIPTNQHKFLSCFSYDKETCSLRFFYKFGRYYNEQIELFFGTSGARIGNWTSQHLIDDKDYYTLVYDYLMLVIEQLDSIDRIERLSTLAEINCRFQHVGVKIFEHRSSYGDYEDHIKKKSNYFQAFSNERILQLKNKEIRTQEDRSL